MRQMKTKPFPYQAEVFEQSKDERFFAILWEQGTGKTKLTIDTLCYNYDKGSIDAVILVAPSGVHTNWRLEQWPKHGWESVPAHFFEWESGKANGKRYQKRFEGWVKNETTLPILTCIYDALNVKNLQKAFKALLKHKKCIAVILDESSKIKNPKAVRTKVAIKLGKMNPIVLKRILSGTPGNSPFHFFSQFNFLDESILNCSSYVNFKHLHGQFVRRKAHNAATGKSWYYDHLLSYRNIDILQERIAPHSSRVLKKDVKKDLPPKLYDVQRFNLTARQEEAYTTLQDEMFLEYGDAELTVNHAMVMVGKLQQICNGFLKMEDGTIVKFYDKLEELPKIKYIMDFLEANEKKISLRAAFTQDLDNYVNAIASMKGEDGRPYNTVRCDGRVKMNQRFKYLQQFESTDFWEIAGILMNMSVLTMGVDILATDVLFFASHTFIYDDRVQCEDRSHREGQKEHLNVIDLIMHGTVDELFITSHEEKKDVAELMIGDQFVNLLREYHRG